MKNIDFIKMHGLGNDFVIIDIRKQQIEINDKIINKISNRKTGAGCDQIITFDKSLKKGIDAKITIFNSNGDEAEACGNGTRCVAKILFKELNKKEVHIESFAGILNAKLNFDKSISVNMGLVRNHWSDIPLSKKMDNKNIPIKINNFSNGFAINIGNPHIVFFGKNINIINLKKIGKKIENHKFFPKKINVEFVKIIKKNKIKMRVWERGVGETLACGSGACAAVYASYTKGLINNNCEVILKKGSLYISVKKNNEIIMTGPAETSFYGYINI